MRLVLAARAALAALLAAGSLTATRLSAATPPAPAEPFTFAAFGCMPYARLPGSDAAFERLITEVNRHAPAFSVHLGDIIGGEDTCTDAVLLHRRDQFNRFDSALVYTPGDNEWTDVYQERAGKLVPAERLAKIRSLFFAEERSLGRQPLPLITQRRDPAHATFVENARWTHRGVVFATVHVVGSQNNRLPAVPGALEEAEARDLANEAWLHAAFTAANADQARGVVLFFQADPFAADRGRPGYDAPFERVLKTIETEARAFARPVLLVHADEHRYRLDVGLRFQRDAAPVPNVSRLETFGAANLHAVLVTVDPESVQVFAAGPLLVPGNALPVLPRPKAAAKAAPAK